MYANELLSRLLSSVVLLEKLNRLLFELKGIVAMKRTCRDIRILLFSDIDTMDTDRYKTRRYDKPKHCCMELELDFKIFRVNVIPLSHIFYDYCH